MNMQKTSNPIYTIAIAGTGYVGLSNAILLSQHNKVYAVDINSNKVDAINKKYHLLLIERLKNIFLPEN